MVSRTEQPPSGTGSQPPARLKTAGKLAGRGVKVGIYCVVMPTSLLLKETTHLIREVEPAMWAVSVVGWAGGRLIQGASRIAGVAASLFTKGAASAVVRGAQTYISESFSKAKDIRGRVGTVVTMVAAPIPVIGQTLVMAESFERAAEEKNAALQQGFVQRVCNIGTSLFPMIGKWAQNVTTALEWTGKKIADISWVGVTDPGRITSLFQNLSSRFDSYAWRLSRAEETPPIKVKLLPIEEREKYRANDEEFRAFLSLEGNDQKVFEVLSYPEFGLRSAGRREFQQSWERVKVKKGSQEDIENVKLLVGMHKAIPKDFLHRSLTPQTMEKRILAANPISACLRILELVRESAKDLDQSEMKLLSRHKNCVLIKDWQSIPEKEQRQLEEIMLIHFNRLSLKDQRRLYDVTIDQIEELSSQARDRFFLEAQKKLEQASVEQFKGKEASTYTRQDRVAFIQAVNRLPFDEKVTLQPLLAPSAAIVAFTEKELRSEISKVERSLKGRLSPSEKTHLQDYLMALREALENSEAYIPPEELSPVTSVSAPTLPSVIGDLQQKVGYNVFTQGKIASAFSFFGRTSSLSAQAMEQLEKGVAAALGPLTSETVVRSTCAIIGAVLTFVGRSEESILATLQTLGIKEEAFALEAYALKIPQTAFGLVQSLAGATGPVVKKVNNFLQLVASVINTGKSGEFVQASAEELCAAIADPAIRARVTQLAELAQVCTGGKTPSPALVKSVAPAVRSLLPHEGLVAQLCSPIRWLWGKIGWGKAAQEAKELTELKSVVERMDTYTDSAAQYTTALRIRSVLDHIPIISGILRTSAALGVANTLSGVKHYLSVFSSSLEVGNVAFKLSSDAALAHLKWVGLAQEAQLMTSKACDIALRHAEQMAPESKTLTTLGTTAAAASSYILPAVVAYGFGTAGLVMTSLLLSYAVRRVIPACGDWFGPRTRPAWIALCSTTESWTRTGGAWMEKKLTATGEYLQQHWNTLGGAIDPVRVDHFFGLSAEEKRTLFEIVMQAPKVPGKVKEEMASLYSKFDSLGFETKRMYVQALLGAFDLLGPEDLIAISSASFGSLAPYLQERVRHIVKRHAGLTRRESKDDGLVAERFNSLLPEQRAELSLIPLYEYYQLSSEDQAKLRFLITHSKAYRAAHTGIPLEEYRRKTKGKEIEELLSFYPKLDPADLNGLTPADMEAAGNGRIQHMFEIVRTYNARGLTEYGLDRLPDLLGPIGQYTLAELRAKKRFIEGLTSLFRQLTPYQQEQLLTMTERESEEICANPARLELCCAHILAKTKIALTKPVSAREVRISFNRLSPMDRAAFFQNMHIGHNELEPMQKEIETIDLQLNALKDVVRKARYDLGVVVSAATLIHETREVTRDGKVVREPRGDLSLTADERAKVLRYEAQATGQAAKVEMYGSTISQLLSKRSQLLALVASVDPTVEIREVSLEMFEEDALLQEELKAVLGEKIDAQMKAYNETIESQKTAATLESTVKTITEVETHEVKSLEETIEQLQATLGRIEKDLSTATGLQKVKLLAELTLVKHRLIVSRYWLTYQSRAFKRVEECITKQQVSLLRPPNILTRILTAVASFFKRLRE